MPHFLEPIAQDFRYAARLLRLNPGFAIVAVLSLALGIGANTAIFQLLNAVRLRTLPVQNPQELAIIRIANRDWASGSFTGRYSYLTYAMWEQIRDHQQGFSNVFAWAADNFDLSSGGESRYASGMWVTGDFFNTLGVPALMGRTLGPSDDQRGCGSPGAVISYAFWQREFGGNASALGRKLTLDGHPFEIVGITPAGFSGIDVGRSFDVALPVCAVDIIRPERKELDTRHFWWLAAVGRLKPGWSIEKATAQLNAISPAAFEATIPPVYNAEGVKHYREYKLAAFPAANGFSRLRQEYQSPLWLLLALAGLVLLIACANLANLMLARASTRERELAVRLALGASRRRLIRQLLAESLLLAIIGTVLGGFLATVLSRSLITYLTTQGNRLYVDLGLDWHMLGFTVAVAVLTCLLFGLAPALRATKTDPGAAMKAGSRGVTAARERHGLRRALVVSQVCLSLVLLVGALLFARSLRNLLIVDAGFQRTGILIANVDLTRLKLPVDQRLQYRRNLLERLQTIPGAEGVAEASIIPLSGNGWNQNVIIGSERKESAFLTRIAPGYFQTLGTPLLAGRDFNDHDTATSPKVAIVNEKFVQKFLGGGNPVGKTFHLEQRRGYPDPIFEIVGLVRNTKYRDLREDFEPIAFFPASQDMEPDPFPQYIIRSRIDMVSLVASVKRTIAEANPAITIDFQVFNTQIREGLLRERLMATLSGFFGFLAAVLATVGLYGVISYMVVRRRNEIGIRMALGATERNVIGMILREAAMLLGVGVIAGTVLAVAGARVVKSMLFGLKPSDPLTLLLAVAALGAVAMLASYFPAYRAAKLDPMVALRDE